MSTAPDDQNRQFVGRVKAAVATAEAWDADSSLLVECRAQIPFQDIAAHTREDDVLYRGNALFLKQLTLYFKEKFMTWVNNPPCAKCGNAETTARTPRGPTSPEEIEGGASRVEVYYCPTCEETTTTFPRYNSVRKLLETRKGRCGEFANLFGLVCRSVGFEVRYCADFTDHVWVECLVDGEWIMADACEGLIDKNGMYESGWNKKLSYIVGVTVDSAVDVTPRYTRRWFAPDFQAQRRAVCSSEDHSQRILKVVNDTLKEKCSKSRCDELDRRFEKEQKMLSAYQQAMEWTEDEKHGQGRISGSLQWKLSREEAGTLTGNEETSSSSVQTWHVESFCPPTKDGGITISITPKKGIIVSGAECSVVGSAISVVVLDESYLGCILQSRGFHSWRDVSNFVETLPKHRIVAIQGKGQKQEKEDCSKKGLLRLGGFVAPTGDDGLLYLGQVGAKPSWARCSAYSEESSGIHVFLPCVEPKASMLRLRTERDTVPRRVAWRLPESVMPLQTQLLATEEQKRTAFLRFAQSGESHSKRHVGYTTKPNAPVYLLDAKAYPLAQIEGGWNTYHYLPDPLVPQDDVGIVAKNKTGVPTVDIPLDSSFFISLFGPSLLANTNGASAALLDTPNALHNSRLVGLYFSAHWCPPCRRFTPMLAELYSHLKEEFPTHGLEVVFVSSDRDESGFHQYFGSMPWMAVPFQSGGTIIPRIKARFGVNGIPALVVLDAMSGQIVVSMSESRAEVMQACQGGDDRIEDMLQSWIARIPQESLEIMRMLELSCEEDDTKANSNSRSKEHAYLTKSSSENESATVDTRDPSELIRETFSRLIADGLEPNAAAAKAIQMVAEQKKNATTMPSFDAGPLNNISWKAMENTEAVTTEQVASCLVSWNDSGVAALHAVVTTAQKYLENASREPWNPRFRNFKLSNKVVDRITRVEGALELVCSLGLYIYPTETDFFVCIPLSTDLDQMKEAMNNLLSTFSQE